MTLPETETKTDLCCCPAAPEEVWEVLNELIPQSLPGVCLKDSTFGQRSWTVTDADGQKTYWHEMTHRRYKKVSLRSEAEFSVYVSVHYVLTDNDKGTCVESRQYVHIGNPFLRAYFRMFSPLDEKPYVDSVLIKLADKMGRYP